MIYKLMIFDPNSSAKHFYSLEETISLESCAPIQNLRSSHSWHNCSSKYTNGLVAQQIPIDLIWNL